MNLNEIDFKKLHLQSKAVQFLCAICLAILLVVIGYFAVFKGQWEEYQSNVTKETELKDEYEKKSIEAASLENLQIELEDLKASIAVLLKQLPTDSEVPTLLQEMHQAAAKNGLTMNSVVQETPVIEKPIERLPFSIAVTGNYDQIAQFARDVGQMSRIVILSNVKFTSDTQNSGKKADAGKLTFTAIANTYKAMNDTDAQAAASAERASAEAASKEAAESK